MPNPRYAQMSLASTPYYQRISRCVRRAFLCDIDTFTKKSYEHRRQWLEDKLQEIGDIFAIDICSYAIMSNHYHVVLHINNKQAKSWSFDEVINQWHKLCGSSVFSQRYLQGHKLIKAEREKLKEEVEV